MESYTVKFWITNQAGFRQQLTETVSLDSNRRDEHKRAASHIMEKYRGARPEIVSVIYQ
jgi:hypothetical protein